MSNNIQNSFTRILLVAVMAMACFAMNAQRLSHTNENKRGTIEQQIANAPINYNNQKVDALLKLAFSFRGTPYVYGASRPGAFDCSGFTSYVFSQFGYSLDRTSRGQVNNGRSVSRSELKPGDLVFFTVVRAAIELAMWASSPRPTMAMALSSSFTPQAVVFAKATPPKVTTKHATWVLAE